MYYMHCQIPVKGDLFSKIANLSTLLLHTVARVVKEKRKKMLHNPYTYKPTVITSLFSLFLLSRFHGNFGLN